MKVCVSACVSGSVGVCMSVCTCVSVCAWVCVWVGMCGCIGVNVCACGCALELKPWHATFLVIINEAFPAELKNYLDKLELWRPLPP